MANLLWGKVFYQDQFAGYLREEPGLATSFTYDETYLSAHLPPIAHTLPLQTAPHVYPLGLLPFFDNLVAEGWLEQAQTRLLGKRTISRFALLLTFGLDCIGAVSVLDPSPMPLTDRLIDKTNPKELALLKSRASLSGIQPKLALTEKKGLFYPAKINELSTYIAKFPSAHHADLVWNEYLTMLAFQALLPGDLVCEFQLGEVAELSEQALIIKRFDRKDSTRLHFEEFNQLLNKPASEKYEGAYVDMAHFIRNEPNCLPIEVYRLYLRILAGILLGNTDMHLKNFALLYTPQGLR
jgi:serine/threonine-protein kinase HipA